MFIKDSFQNPTGPVVAGTGHRPTNKDEYNTWNRSWKEVRLSIKKELMHLQPKVVLSGMALGYDQVLCECCLELDLPFIAVAPFKGQESVWPIASREKYQDLLCKAKEVVIVSEGGYGAYKMQIRNEWLVNHCDVVLAYYKSGKGGTYNCIEYARGKQKEIIYIDC